MTIDDLQSENARLLQCLKAYETAEARVVRVEIVAKENQIFPALVVTAPNMNERRIAAYLIDFYKLFAATAGSLASTALRSQQWVTCSEIADRIEARGQKKAARFVREMADEKYGKALKTEVAK